MADKRGLLGYGFSDFSGSAPNHEPLMVDRLHEALAVEKRMCRRSLQASLRTKVHR
jgi:hypothetical protein